MAEVEDDHIRLKSSCVSEDLEKIMEMIETLKILPDNASTVEKAYENFWKILSNFQDQPHLLDGHLDVIINPLVGEVMKPKSSNIRCEAFKYLHTVMKVRGYKRAVRYMPHEVTNLEVVMTMLESADLESKCWQASYVLLVWLSILVLTPFPLSYFDSPCTVEGQLPTMTFRIESVIKKHLMSNDKLLVSSNFAANFYTRVDVKEKMLSPFFDWINSVIRSKKELTISKVAAMAGAAAILKRGEREDLIEHAKNLLMVILEETNEADNASLLYRKYKVKLVQRIGLTFLKKWKIKWRYEKGCCSLLQNLTKNVDPAVSSGDESTNITDLNSLSSQEQLLDEDEQFEAVALECLSEVIDNFIDALQDSDTVVRWSAAKGIGRITERLTQQMGDMVLTSVLEIFSEMKSHFSWHGACLAIAQMASRGLLSKPRLTEVVKHIISALKYDEPRRYSSVGENIRDAACYVFWAFARFFNEEDLKPLSNLIMTNLLLVALFDREIHCRRAASAAFQEYVGRCSSVPNGIAIMTEADYMSVGVRNNAYLHVSVQIGKIGGFTKAMIEHLIVNRLRHWDAVIRDIAAKALNLLSPFEPLFIASFLPLLVRSAHSGVLTERLGAMPGIAEIIHGLYATGNMGDYVDDVTLINVKSIIPKYRQEGLFRGIGGDMMKGSCCRYIWKCSEARLEVDDIAEDWLFVLQESVYNVNPEIREVAVIAFNSFLEDCFSATISQKIVTEYVSVLSAVENGDFHQACAASVLGHIPNVVIENYLDIIIPALIKCAHITPATIFFTESRQIAIKSLLHIVMNTSIHNFSEGTVDEIFWCFVNALDDYANNKKGDIGSHVRCEATASLLAFTRYIITHRIMLLKEIVMENMVPKIMQLALEPQDKVRTVAIEALITLIHSEPEVPYIPAIEHLKKIFPSHLYTDESLWLEGVQTYSSFIEVLLLLEPHYMHHVLVGFIKAIGGISERTVLNVSAVLFETLEEIPFEKACAIAKGMLKILDGSNNVEHLSNPVLFFFNRLLDCGALNHVLLDEDANFATDILSIIKRDMRKYRDFNRMKAVISILSALTLVKGHVGLEAFQILIRYLNHNSVAVRSAAATRMFETFSLLDDDDNPFPGCNMQVVMKHLAETRWKGSKDDYADAVLKISEEMSSATKL